jgi:hypothetical protein
VICYCFVVPKPKQGSPEATPDAGATNDVVFVHSKSERGLNVLRFREDRVEAGEMRAPRDGEPLYGELLRLSAREESDRLFDCEVVANAAPAAEPRPAAPAPAPSAPAVPMTGNERRLGHKGPSRTTSPAYRDNWDAIFASARRTKPSELN